MKFAEHIMDCVGDTPLVRLNVVTEGLAPTILAKIEYLNPGGSAKDRIARAMIEAAEVSGELRPGGTIVEPTSGNTGVGLALVAQRRGYDCIFVCPDKVGQDKIDVLRAYGAEVVVCPTGVSPEDPRSYYSVSDRLAREIDGGWKPNQYANQNGPASHYRTTGPEIWRDTDGKVTHFVAGVGTGGTISGAGRYLQEASNGAVSVVGADPVNSVYSGGDGRPYLVEGVGEDFWPEAYDSRVPDQVIAIGDAESMTLTRRLAREEGLLVGGSCGMAVGAALELARQIERNDHEHAADAVIVVLLPDGGRGYLAKIFSDSWMRSHGFLGIDPPSIAARRVHSILDGGQADVGDRHQDASGVDPSVGRRDADGGRRAGRNGPRGTTALDRSIGDFLAANGATPATLQHVSSADSVAKAVATLGRTREALPVLSHAPPAMFSEVLGAVRVADLLAALARGAEPADSVSDHVGEPLPLIGSDEDLARAVALLGDGATDTAVVMDGGRPVGLIDRREVLAALTGDPAARAEKASPLAEGPLAEEPPAPIAGTTRGGTT